MSWQTPIAVILATFTVCCGGQPAPQRVEQPTLETLEPVQSGPIETLGEAVPPGFFRPCQIVVAAGGVVELNCDQYQIVEFRRPKSSGNGDQDLNDLMTILGARFGEIRESRRDAQIDSLPIRLSDFRSAKDTGPRGLAASVSNSAGAYWAFACYKKGGDFSKGFCGDAIAAAARAGGLAYVEAKPLEDFGEGQLETPASCTRTPGSKISCTTGSLTWSPKGGPSAATLREETLGRLRTLAKKEKVEFKQEDVACTLLGKNATCLQVSLASKSKGESLYFVLATGGEQERPVVCSYPSAATDPLPEPCDQAIKLQPKR